MDKSFIITELEYEELETSLKKKIDNFLLEKFGEFAFKQCSTDVDCDEYFYEDRRCSKDQFSCELHIEVKFTPYKYKTDKLQEERIESFYAVFEHKGKKPFYIGGKFVSLNVFEWIMGSTFQKHDKIFGVTKDEMYNLINDLIMDC